MPVSSPSYFPPAGGQGQIVGTTAGIGAKGVRMFLAGASAGNWTSTGLNDLVVVGDSAFSAGTSLAPITDTNLAGAVILGSKAGQAVTVETNFGGGFGAPVLIGFQALGSSTSATTMTVIGYQALRDYVPNVGNPIGGSVVIGHQASVFLTGELSGFGSGYTSNVAIGQQALSGFSFGATQLRTVVDNVAIGYQAMPNIVGPGGVGGSGIIQNVVIGSHAALQSDTTATGTVGNVYIGFQVGSGDPSGHPGASVLIGSSVTAGVASVSNCVAIGALAIAGTLNNIAIGIAANGGVANNVCLGGLASGVNRSIAIGRAANVGVVAADDQLLFETFDAGTSIRRALIYGRLANVGPGPGGVIIGHSTQGTNRDIPGFNVLKVLDGTWNGAAPAGGGLIYVTSTDEAIHWVDATGQDAAIGPSGPAFFATGLGRITPVALAANTNDYAPAGFAAAQVVRISSTAAFNLTGLAGGAAGRLVALINVGANNITLTNQDAGSAAANRFSLPGAASVVLGANGSIELWYDAVTGNWRSLNR